MMKRYIRANSAIDISDYENLSSTLEDGGHIFALFRKKDANGHVSWAAAQYVAGEPDVQNAFAITYEQARGFEPLSNIGRLSRYIGKRILSAEKSYQLYRNIRNHNKYIETRRLTDGHTEYRSFMYWNTDRGSVKNYYTSKSNKGRWHRTSQESLKRMLEDYEPVESIEDDVITDFTHVVFDDELTSSQCINQACNIYGDSYDDIDDDSQWPEELTYDIYPEGDQIISTFVDVVGDLDLFEEPSARGGIGTDFFYNEFGEELARIDLQDEEGQLERMYFDSTSQQDFKNKVTKWMKNLCGLR